jgi:hypothetical protein
MSAAQPDHHDAELLLQVYDLRRETSLREARTAINGEFWPVTYDDIVAILKLDHPLNAFWRQASTYWEMVYGIARHGIVHPEYWMESNGEGLLLFAKVSPWLADLRRDANPASFRHAEWVATQTAEGRRIFQVFRTRVDKALEARRT